MTTVLAWRNEGLVVNACCPGFVDTEMGRIIGHPPKSPKDAAKIPIRLAFGNGNGNGVTGRFWAKEDNASTGEGEVQGENRVVKL
jgi:carbonyl reductase 1